MHLKSLPEHMSKNFQCPIITHAASYDHSHYVAISNGDSDVSLVYSGVLWSVWVIRRRESLHVLCCADREAEIGGCT